MRNLIGKELRELFSSVIGGVIGILFILAVYLFIWVLPGSMNLFETGYVSLEGFTRIIYNLLFLTIPLWAMNSYAIEQRFGTTDWLRSLPITETDRIISKFCAAMIGFGVLIWIAFFVYFPIILLIQSSSDVDWGVVVNSYFGIMLLVSYALSMNLFVSSKINNSIASVVVSMIANFVLFYGLGMVRGMVGTGWLYDVLAYFDPANYYQDWMRGVIDSRAIIFFVSFVLFFMLVGGKNLLHKGHRRITFLLIGSLIGLNLFNVFFFTRFDCTQERLYSISTQTKTLIKAVDRPVRITLFLTGSLNPGFRKLAKSTQDLLMEYRAVANKFDLHLVDPSVIPNFENTFLCQTWTQKGLNGVAVKEISEDGSFKQKLVYPYIEFTDGTRTITINLLVNDPSKTGAENLNASIEQLEYVVTDGLSRLMQKEIKKIAFIEGHGELDEPYLNGALDLISNYYIIDRGAFEGVVEPLLSYSALIIAAPKDELSAQDLFVLDQYVSLGGSVFWNVSPAQIKPIDENNSSEWTASARDLGLTELFFQYGIRIKSNLIMDAQCSKIPLKVGEGADVELAPWYYSPLFKPNPNVNFLANVASVELPFSSAVEIMDRRNDRFTVKPLLLSSALSQECPLPHSIALRHVSIEANSRNFSKSGLVSAVLIEGVFPSLYAGRLSPIDHRIVPKVKEEKRAKVVVVASGDLLKNKVSISQKGVEQVYPLGFNPYLQEPTGNRDFVLNTVKYLCGDDQLIGLSRKQFRLRVLSKAKIEEYRTLVRIIAVVVPTLLLILLSFVVFLRRKRTNAKR